jgi:hypothetical protein
MAGKPRPMLTESRLDFADGGRYRERRKRGVVMNQDEALWKELGLDIELHRRILDSITRNYAAQVRAQTGRPVSVPPNPQVLSALDAALTISNAR